MESAIGRGPLFELGGPRLRGISIPRRLIPSGGVRASLVVKNQSKTRKARMSVAGRRSQNRRLTIHIT